MKREFLEKLGLEKETIDKIMDEHGKSVESHKSKKDELQTSLDDLTEQLKKRDQDLKDLKKQAEGNEELQKKYDTLEKQYKDDKKTLETKIKDTQLSSALKIALSGDVHDADLVSTLLDKTKIELDENGNVKAGLKEQMEALRESKAFLFVPKDASGNKLSGFTPADGSKTPPGAGKNPFSKEHFNLTEQGRLLRDDPELYKQLQAQAGN